jgi:general secretion pathway protein C
LLGAAPVREAAPGVVAVQSPLASRFRLLGVAAPRQGGDRSGLALIAVDGKPARSYMVGAAVDGDLVLQSVHPRGAKLGGHGADAQVSLELPALPAPATGSLPVALPPSMTPPGLVAPGMGMAGPIATPQVAQPPPDQSEAAPVPVPPPTSQPGAPATTR